MGNGQQEGEEEPNITRIFSFQNPAPGLHFLHGVAVGFSWSAAACRELDTSLLLFLLYTHPDTAPI